MAQVKSPFYLNVKLHLLLSHLFFFLSPPPILHGSCRESSFTLKYSKEQVLHHRKNPLACNSHLQGRQCAERTLYPLLCCLYFKNPYVAKKKDISSYRHYMCVTVASCFFRRNSSIGVSKQYL